MNKGTRKLLTRLSPILGALFVVLLMSAWIISVGEHCEKHGFWEKAAQAPEEDAGTSLEESVENLGNSAIQYQEELMECRRELISIKKEQIEQMKREEKALRVLLKAVKEKE